ncbi:hypothetical protein HOF92_15175 [bacterium]|jgi:hypothetical protein|nr:hypothetical protein [bacterium]
MHPVIQGFVESVQIPRESSGPLEGIQEIRERPVLSIAIRRDAIRSLDLIQPFSILLETLGYPTDVDLYCSLWGDLGEKELTLLDYLRQRVGSFGFLSNAPASHGFLLAAGANRVVLGDHVGFRPFDRRVKTKNHEITYQDLRCFQRNFPKQNLLDSFLPMEVLPLLNAAESAAVRLKRAVAGRDKTINITKILERYVESPEGLEVELSRSEVKDFGLPVTYGEEEGILGSMRELQKGYTTLVCMSTSMEGTHQFTQGNPSGVPMNREYNFKARAELQGIVESASMRLICFRVTGLPPENTEEVVWVQK